MPTAEKVICPSCSRKYAYRPELAGKKVKCKCGQMILVEAPEDADDDSFDSAPADDIVAVARAAESSSPDTGYRCPGCRQPMNPGSYLCDSCGFNLRTGVKPVERPAAAAGALSASKGFNIKTPGGGGKPKLALKSGAASRPGGKKKGSGFQMSPVLIVGIIALVGSGAYWGSTYFGGDKTAGSNAAPSRAKHKDDLAVAALMANEGPTEVREWLAADSSHMLGTGWNRKQADARMNDLYEMGAVKITAFSSGICQAFAVELPTEPEKRAALFTWENKWHEAMSKEIATDVGQKYLLIATPK